MRSLYQRIKKYIPTWVLIIYLITLISAIVYALCAFSVIFADFINNFCAPIRAVFSVVTSVVPFFIFEILILISPILFVLLIIFAVKSAYKSKEASIRFISYIVAFFCCYFISFVWTIASGYYTTPIEKKMDLELDYITKNEIYDTTILLSHDLNRLSRKIKYDKNGSSVMGYSYLELSEKISQAYKDLSKNKSFPHTFDSKIKPIVLSVPITYANISGIYIPLTAEAGVNTNYSDFVIASTSAHEMAHQRGVARESETSFVSFLALYNSGDSYLKYSAELDACSRLLLSLKKEDINLYNKAIAQIDNKVITDYNNHITHNKKYSSSSILEASNTINNSYLQVNGEVDGIKSYDKVSSLICAYFTSKY
ncbi:MAG: DUF3810 domain-containing protein [Clostridia bacterium]|nr:DUF3810 domain-containing protein [Clostridia bacterium]